MVKDAGIEGIYIVHAKHGYEEHERRIRKVFGDFGLDFELVTDGDPTGFTPGLLNTYFCSGILDQMPKGTVSCTLNHIFCYERMVRNHNRFALIFENDPFFLGNFPEQVTKLATEASMLEPGFIISLENTTLEFPPMKQMKRGKLLYEASRGRCAGAYLVDLKAARDILHHLQTSKCCQVVDWWHNTLISDHVIRMYWAHPPIVEQGSHNGLMSSTISTKNKSLGRRFRWMAQKYYKTYITRWFK